MWGVIYIYEKISYESHVSRHTYEPLKKYFKKLETRPQSSKNAEK